MHVRLHKRGKLAASRIRGGEDLLGMILKEGPHMQSWLHIQFARVVVGMTSYEPDTQCKLGVWTGGQGWPHLPLAEEADDEVGAKALVQQLGDEVQVGDQGGLQDDGHVAGVEQLDGVGALRPAPLLAAHRQVHPEALQ